MKIQLRIKREHIVIASLICLLFAPFPLLLENGMMWKDSIDLEADPETHSNISTIDQNLQLVAEFDYLFTNKSGLYTHQNLVLTANSTIVHIFGSYSLGIDTYLNKTEIYDALKYKIFYDNDSDILWVYDIIMFFPLTTSTLSEIIDIFIEFFDNISSIRGRISHEYTLLNNHTLRISYDLSQEGFSEIYNATLEKDFSVTYIIKDVYNNKTAPIRYLTQLSVEQNIKIPAENRTESFQLEVSLWRYHIYSDTLFQEEYMIIRNAELHRALEAVTAVLYIIGLIGLHETDAFKNMIKKEE